MLTLTNLLADQPDFAIWYKPAGLSIHSEQGEGFVAQASRLANVDYYPVHRLDQGTSGLLILAKNATAAAEFGVLFSQHQVEKYYLALSVGKPKQKQGWVKGDMAPARGGNYKLLATQQNPAVSYFVSHSLAADSLPTATRLYVVKPWSGKTHQIRVALKSMAAPIAGDDRYGGVPADRLYLHALALAFCYQGQQFQFQVAPVEGDWFLHSACQEVLGNVLADVRTINWPRYQKPRSI